MAMQEFFQPHDLSMEIARSFNEMGKKILKNNSWWMGSRQENIQWIWSTYMRVSWYLDFKNRLMSLYDPKLFEQQKKNDSYCSVLKVYS